MFQLEMVRLSEIHRSHLKKPSVVEFAQMDLVLIAPVFVRKIQKFVVNYRSVKLLNFL